MSIDLHKVANVLDAAATYMECVEREKAASALSKQETLVNKVASAHVSALGESIPDDVREKLAGADPAVLSYLEGMLVRQAGHVESLGGSAPLEDEGVPTSKTAADAADMRFINWAIKP